MTNTMVETIPLITAIYIFDNYGNRYGADKYTVKTCRIDNITKANWYHKVLQEQGAYILQVNAGGIFNENSGRDPYVSLIRVINDLNTQKPIGILIINISNQAMIKSFSGVDRKYFTDLVLKDERNRDILNINGPSPVEVERLVSSRLKAYYSLTHQLNGKWYLISEMKINEFNWKLLSVMPFDELSRESHIFTLITFAIFLLNGILLFVGFIFISKLITVPVHKLIQSMKDVEHGEFNIVDFKTGNDEMGKLKDGFNLMVQEIRKLIDRTVAEQKKIRQTELEVLQAQIKPHFLYNTFDAISSLALSGRSQDVYTIMKALGSYYRLSLSKGNQIISVGEEIAIVKNYLIIQQIRYGDLFSVWIEVDETVSQYQIPKLILQPLVENSIYHGIRPKGEKGTITVTAQSRRDYFELTVADDGVGMDQNTIAKLISSEQGENRTSFGLRGTIERLRLFYGLDHVLTISSEPGKGVVIAIRIPLQGVV